MSRTRALVLCLAVSTAIALKLVNAWEHRYCQDACGAVADGMDKKLKDMEQLMGIETDDDAGNQLPPLASLGIANRPVITMKTVKGGKKK
jgi:hypothetical protein